MHARALPLNLKNRDHALNIHERLGPLRSLVTKVGLSALTSLTAA
jgi:hypothetical protein